MTECRITHRNLVPAPPDVVGAGPRACPFRSRAWAVGQSGTGVRGRQPFEMAQIRACASRFGNRATTGGCPYELRTMVITSRGFSLLAMPGVRAKPGVPNKANLRSFRAENEDRRKNKANWASRAVGGHGPPYGMVGETPGDRRKPLSPGKGT